MSTTHEIRIEAVLETEENAISVLSSWRSNWKTGLQRRKDTTRLETSCDNAQKRKQPVLWMKLDLYPHIRQLRGPQTVQ
jgi:hypothetical protein